MRSCIVDELPARLPLTPRGLYAPTPLYSPAFGVLSATARSRARLLFPRGSAICLPAFTFDSAAAIHHCAGSRGQSGVNSGPKPALGLEIRRERRGAAKVALTDARSS